MASSAPYFLDPKRNGVDGLFGRLKASKRFAFKAMTGRLGLESDGNAMQGVNELGIEPAKFGRLVVGDNGFAHVSEYGMARSSRKRP